MGMIVGYEKEKRELAHLHDMLYNANRYREYGIRIPRGLVLYGEPGVGKTILAKSIATDGINLIELRAANCCEENAAEEIKNVFESAKQHTPAIILLDELDKIAGTSGAFFMETNDTVKKILLQELDALDESENILVVATCNDTNSLGGALLRAGRFDRQLHIDLPDEETRLLILQKYFGRLKAKKELELEYIARLTHGYTGAQLECLANESGIIAMTKSSLCVDMNDIRLVMNKFAFGSEEKTVFKDMDELRKIAIHEAGHALVAMLLTPNNIHGASVLPQGESSGHIQYLNPESAIVSVKDIENEITVLLAGRIAERMVFDKYFTGAVSDIERASSLLYFLITDCAAYGYAGASFTVHTLYRREIVSEQVKAEVNTILKDKLEEFDKFAEHLIDKSFPVFEALVTALMEKHTLSREELFEILMPHGTNLQIA